jgi:SAM-dependent methyltransferase
MMQIDLISKGNSLKLVNLGCGNYFHPEWINIDKYSFSAQVIAYDVMQGLPFDDRSINAVYSSHLIEHLPLERIEFLCREVFRVLKPEGIFRVVTPDLEAIVRTYLEKLHDALEGKARAADEYDWMVMELFDQAGRDRRGGEMAVFLRKHDLSIRDFIKGRLGCEVEGYWDCAPLSPLSIIDKIRSVSPTVLLQYARNLAAKVLVYVVAGRSAAEAFDVGLFRRSGEIHIRLYDRYSLQRILVSAGFSDINVCKAAESRIPRFDKYELDIIAGEIRKPDSFYMEGIKP